MLRVGLIGFGKGAQTFHAPLIASVEGLELAAAVERHSDLAASRYPGIATYRSTEAILADGSLDLLVVCTPTGDHFSTARAALEAGKNLVVDKPMAVHSAQIAELIALAASKQLKLVPFHNRRWDNQLRTLKKLLDSGSLGRLATAEIVWDRWRPARRPERWREQPVEGAGMLLDLGTHLADQALTLFGKPAAVAAEIASERGGPGPEDSFSLRLHYADGLLVTVASTSLGAQSRPMFHLRGMKGNYVKLGLDPQEEALSKLTRIDPAQPWAVEPQSAWGTLWLDENGTAVARPVEPVPGDFRLFYSTLRDFLLGSGPAPIAAVEAWRVARLFEWARQSAAERREIACDWSQEPR